MFAAPTWLADWSAKILKWRGVVGVAHRMNSELTSDPLEDRPVQSEGEIKESLAADQTSKANLLVTRQCGQPFEVTDIAPNCALLKRMIFEVC